MTEQSFPSLSHLDTEPATPATQDPFPAPPASSTAPTFVPLDVYEAAVEQRDAARSERDRLSGLVSSAEGQMELYKARVRVQAIQAAADEGWCLAGLNSALEDLDLEPLPAYYTVEVEVTSRQIVHVRVDVSDLPADERSPEGAEAWVTSERDAVLNTLDPQEWEWDTSDLDVRDVSPEDD